ncbi:MAG: hypothetical protein RSA68_03185 [Hafnia sp.]|uniref:hypothetical protein n=1 Tax=Hafnia sp. TaxID=1873498 RepID=UPI002FC75139
MDADIISFESLLAAQEAARWSLWTMIGGWVSGLATTVACFIALRSTNSWREQEKYKRIILLKESIFSYKSTLYYVPNDFKPSPEFKDIAFQLQGALDAIHKQCLLLGYDEMPNNEIWKAFFELFALHSELLQGNIKAKVLVEAISKLSLLVKTKQ